MITEKICPKCKAEFDVNRLMELVSVVEWGKSENSINNTNVIIVKDPIIAVCFCYKRRRLNDPVLSLLS